MNPFLQQVVGGVQTDFDRLRDQASRQTGADATAAGAGFGGRRAILEAERLRGLDQLEAQQLGNLRFGGFANAQQIALEDLLRRSQLGLAGLPQQSTQRGTVQGPGPNPALSALGGAGVGSQFGLPGALVGGGIGLLSGLFG
jgi:hypothetical protein